MRKGERPVRDAYVGFAAAAWWLLPALAEYGRGENGTTPCRMTGAER
jgi:hypothetical protein